MTERITYWKCPDCHGTGKRIVGYDSVERCFRCDGTGNAFVDGRARAHARRVAEIEQRDWLVGFQDDEP